MTDNPLPITSENSVSSAKKMRYKIANIRCIRSPTPRSSCMLPRFYLQASVDGETKRTGVSHASSDGSWSCDKPIHFDLKDASPVKLRLYRRYHFCKSYIGETEIQASELSDNTLHRKLRRCSHGTLKDTRYSIHLVINISASPNSTPVQATQIALPVHDIIDDAPSTATTTVQAPHITQPINNSIDDERSTDATIIRPEAADEQPDLRTHEMEDGIKAASEAVKKMKPGPTVPSKVSAAIDLGKTVVESPAAQTLGSLLGTLEFLMPVVDGIAKIHPYAQVACSVLSVIPKTILDQVDRDEKIADLVGTLNDTFSFVHEAESLHKVSKEDSPLQTIVAKMIQQTTECTYFICAYSEDIGFGKRMMRNMLSNTDEKIEEFRKTLEQLKSEFQGAADIETAVRIIQIKMLTESIREQVDHVAESVDFNDMPYAKGAGYETEKTCLPETRKQSLKEIVDWVNTPDRNSPQVLWLSGLAGTGKSTIAHTIARIFDDHQRLGSFFSFDLASLADRNPGNLFSTIARNLTSVDPQWKRSLWNTVKSDRALRTTSSVDRQFENFLLAPIEKSRISLVGPIVIIIDALDESGDGVGRKGILSILGEKIVKPEGGLKLPSNFRIIVTSRPEKDIHAALGGKSHVKRMQMEDIKYTNVDLKLYIKHQFSLSTTIVDELETQWPNGKWSSQLVEKSEGLFQWAATACRFISAPPTGLTSIEQYETILLLPSNLDSLYIEILDRALKGTPPAGKNRFLGVMSILLQLKEPLPMSGLAALCPEEYTYAILESVLSPLGSLLTGIGQDGVLIRPLHTSFRDFLIKDKVSVEDDEHPNPFCVDMSLHSHSIALACLRAMKCLEFNICRMKTSHVRNIADPELPARIKQYISPQLSYSCRFWAAHLKAARCDANMIHMVHETLYIRFLYWLEVLSSISAFNGVSESLSFVKACGENYVSDGLSEATEKLRKDIVVFIEDALQFIGVFGTPISQSAPHIYLSALPSAPTTSTVSQTFLPQFKNIFTYETGERQYWPACQNTFRVPADLYSRAVNVIGLPDAKRFISTFSNFFIRRIKCFIWDVETCSILNELEHSSGIESVAVSQDSEYLVSASWDAICVWNLGSMAVEVRIELVPDDATETRVVTISPDGTCVALAKYHRRSGSKLFVWNARTGRVIAGPFITNGFIALIAFSSDNSKLYSVTWRVPVCVTVWDVESGSSEVHQLEGDHDPAQIREYDPVLAFSSDRRRLAYCSYNHDQILIYNIEEHNFSFNVKTRSGLFGYTADKPVLCLAFSQDGRRIVSGWRSRFRVWDACTGHMIAGPFEGDGLISSLAFLGEHRIISAGISKEGTIQIWNTVNVVHSEPYGEVIKNISSVDFSPSGEHIVSTGGEKTIRLWDAKTGRACRTHLYIEGSKITFAAFTPDGKHVVTASHGNDIRIWSTADNSMGPVSIIIDEKFDRALEPKISPDSKSVAAVFLSWVRSELHKSRKTIGTWDTTTGSPHQASPKYPFTSELEDKYIQFWDGKLVACTGNANDLYIYDTEKGTVTTKECVGSVYRPVTLSQDHRYVAAYACHNGSHKIMIWDMETGNDSGLLQIESWISCLIFSPNSRFLVSTSFREDGTLLIWDVKCNLAAEPLALRGHRAPVRSVAFSQDSRYIVSGGEDNIIRVWDISDLGDGNGEKPVVEGLPEFGDDDDLADGWVHGPNEELLFWVPYWVREGLYRPRNTVVIGKGANKLNFTRFVHGEDWWKCYTGVSG